jgi:hypothetical protein
MKIAGSMLTVIFAAIWVKYFFCYLSTDELYVYLMVWGVLAFLFIEIPGLFIRRNSVGKDGEIP